MKTHLAFATLAVVLLASGCDDSASDPVPSDVSDDAAVAGDGTDPDSDLTTAPDATAIDATDDDSTDLGTVDAPEDADTPIETPYIEACESLYAVRIVELQLAIDASFPLDCNTPLRDEIGRFSETTGPQCSAGESANACQRRLYDSPPPVTDFLAGCNPADDGCFVAKWVPRCADGTDDGCAEPEAICVDGTRPLVHVEPATEGPSDVWLIHMGGEGGPCNGDKCWLDYRFLDNAAFPKAMSSHHPDYALRGTQRFDGVMDGNVSGNNPFAGFNRVRMERCGDAASDAIEAVVVSDGVDPAVVEAAPDGFGDAPPRTRSSDAPVYHRGYATYLSLFHSLTTVDGRDLNGDGTPDLPDLSAATQVVLSGSSDASNWLVFAGDALAEELRAIAGPGVDVRIMVDGNFGVALDTAGRLHPDAPNDFDAVRNPYPTTGLCTLPDNGDGLDNEACSDFQYTTGPLRVGFDARNILRDASCEAFHGDGHPACSDKLHTLVHHVTTPVLVLADQEDRSVSSAPANFGDDTSYRWLLDDYRAGVLSFALDIQSSWNTDAREEGPGVDGDLALILHKYHREGGNPEAATHVRFGSTDDLQDGIARCAADGTLLATPTFSAMIGAWLDDTLPSPFAIEAGPAWDGTSDYWVTDASCPPPE